MNDEADHGFSRVDLDFPDFERLDHTASHDERVLHALEYIAEAVGVLAKQSIRKEAIVD